MIERGTPLRLQVATLDHFDWMIRGTPKSMSGLTLPSGGIDDPEVLVHVRAITARLQEQACFAAWMMLVGNEIVGLCGFHEPPIDGVAEIGYSVAPERRRRGYATQAVAAIIDYAVAEGTMTAIRADTNAANVASQRALEHNGFLRIGTRLDDEDGELLCWRRDL